MESARNGTNIVILDACRDNPLPAGARGAGASRGLSVVAAPSGSLVIFATAPGQVAQDGEGRNGVFTGALLRHIGTSEVEVMEMLRAVRREVMAATDNEQVPWDHSSLTGAFYFAGSREAPLRVPPTPAPSLQTTVGEIAISVQTGGQLSLDGVPLGELADGQSATLRDVPTGRRSLAMDYGGEQETVLVTVAANASVSALFEYERPSVGEIVITVRTGGRLSLDGEYHRQFTDGQSATLRDVPTGRRSLVMDYGDERETVSVTVATNVLASARFEFERPPEKPDSLETVLVEGGTFRMGSPSGGDDDERPVHSVTVDSFWMTETEVTFAQYDAFARATGRDLPDDVGWGRGTRPVVNVTWSGEVPRTYWLTVAPAEAAPAAPMGNLPDDEGWGRGTRPAINVSWHDAVAYANWLSEQDGLTPAYRISGTEVTWNRSADGWRLPTEAEWEYAARGGTRARETIYAGSNDAGEVAWYTDNSGGKTHPVGEKRANELGLYDMSGNVWEWCWDWYGSYSSESQRNPTGPASGSGRVGRGGGWRYAAVGIRVAIRGITAPLHYLAGTGGSGLGFRLAAPAVQ